MNRRNTLAWLPLLVLGVTIFATQTALAGCNITLKIDNGESAPVNVNFSNTKVKIKNGTWKRMVRGNGPTVDPGSSYTTTYNAVFGCNKQRQYRIHFKAAGDNWTQYYPSASGFTQDTTIIINAKAP